MENNQENEKIINWDLQNPKRSDCISVHIFMEISHFFRFIREELAPFSRELRDDSRLKGFHFLFYPKSDSYITLRIFSDSGDAFFNDKNVKMKIETYLEKDYILKIIREDYDSLENEYGTTNTRNEYEEWLSNNSKFLIDLIDYHTSELSIPGSYDNLDINYSLFISQLVHIFFYQAGIGQNEVALYLQNARNRTVDSIRIEFDQLIEKYRLNNLRPIYFQ